MQNIRVSIISNSKELPQMTCNNFFHSVELFSIIERSSAQSPYMAVATTDEGIVVAHMLAIIRRRGSLMPPYLFTQGRIHGEGDYEPICTDKEKVFGMMLRAITRKFRRKLCLFVEFSDLSQKMFGYRYFRKEGYFCVNWQEVHNSLHSKSPEERLLPKAQKYIANMDTDNIRVEIADTDSDIKGFYTILRNNNRLNLRRLIPPYDQFLELAKSKNANVFVLKYKDKLIGGCVCAYSESNAYLWFLASRNKRYMHLHPNYIMVWKAIDYAYNQGYAHFRFLDAGLPTPGNPHRKFILNFGGKPVAKYRWFKFSIGWINKLLFRIYNE